MNRTYLLRSVIVLSVLSALSACAVTHQRESTSVDKNELILHAGKPLDSWRIQVADFEGQQDLTGTSVIVPKPAQPRVPDSHVGARTSGKDGERDALTLHWKNSWYASLRLVGSKPLDLRPFASEGTLEFDLNVVDMARGGLEFKVVCGDGCERKVPYLLSARAMAGKGWQHLAFPMACFMRDGDDFSAVTQPFVLDGNGTGEVAVANVKFVRHGTANATCPNYRTESVTPSPLIQAWALEWWMPRHQKKLDEIRKLKQAGQRAEVIFIGDSITHGWEDSGLTVWNQHFKKYNALDLGFGGDHTENVLWRLQNGEVDGIQPKVAVLMIGTNNTGDRREDPKTTAAGIKRILDELRRRVPDTKILLLAIFPRDQQPGSPLRQINNRVNTIISGFADERNIFFLNINESLMNADGTLSKDILPDLLHLSEKGYGIWAQRLEPTLQKLLSQPQSPSNTKAE